MDFLVNELFANVLYIRVWLSVWWDTYWVAWSCSLETPGNMDEVCMWNNNNNNNISLRQYRLTTTADQPMTVMRLKYKS